MEQVGDKAAVLYNMSPTNRWTNRGSEPHLGHHVEGCFEEKFEGVGRMFAYNRATHSTTNVSPFQVVYGFNPLAPIDILSLPTSERIHRDAKKCADFILQMHETTKHNIEKMNEKYRIISSRGKQEIKLQPGDLVWLHLRKDTFP